MSVSQHIRGYTYNAGTEKRKEGSCNANYSRRSGGPSYWRYSLFGWRFVTCRDVAHRRLVEEGRSLPIDVCDRAIFHAGPIVRQAEGNRYEIVSVGPTTSMRMEQFEYEFIEKTGVRLIVGKGGMASQTQKACRQFGAIHCVFPAGCAVIAAMEVEYVAGHFWEELGMPETLWWCKVKEFGPLIVSIDISGRNLFEENKIAFEQRKEHAFQRIAPQIGFIK